MPCDAAELTVSVRPSLSAAVDLVAAGQTERETKEIQFMFKYRFAFCERDGN